MKLARAVAMAIPARRSRSRLAKALASPSIRGLRILIVEDHADSRELLRQMVASAGARPMLASDGQEALEMLATARPHIVLCDIRMPGLDGFAVAQHIRADARYGRIPLVAVTALSEDRDYLHTMVAGFDAHLPKPIEYETLLSVLSRFADRARRPRSSPHRAG